jgi:hypothetical protein
MCEGARGLGTHAPWWVIIHVDWSNVVCVALMVGILVGRNPCYSTFAEYLFFVS